LPVIWFTVLITTLISSNFSCWLLYCLSCDIRSDYPFDIFKLFLLVIVLPVMWVTVRTVGRYQRGNQNGNSHDRKYNDQQEKFEDIKGVIRTVTHMTGNVIRVTVLITPLISSTFLVGHCIAWYLIYRSDYHFNIFKLFLLVIVLPVMWYTVLITPLISSER
jgi:hypothetical protein